MKYISWNIDSLNAATTGTSARAILTRNVLEKIAEENADIIALQETKLPEAGMNSKQEAVMREYFPDHDYVFVSSCPPARKGYAGTMALYKKGLDVKASFPDIGAPDTMDMEGRMVTLELPDLFFNLVYTPNAGDGLKRLGDRQIWDKKYSEYIQSLDQIKPVIACGDYNVAHQEIDLAHPENNHMSAGFTDEEREGFTNLLDIGLVDTFRHVNGPVPGAYTWWAQRVKTSKINNSGWRIDYFLVSERLKNHIIRSEMMDSGPRQDHTPILLEMR